MSTTEATPASSEQLAETPNFDLSCLVDDVEHPTEVTVYNPAGERNVTEWITAPLSETVDVEGSR